MRRSFRRAVATGEPGCWGESAAKGVAQLFPTTSAAAECSTGYHRAAGNYLVIDGAATGIDYVYMHMREPALVKTGDRVFTCQAIGEVGETGRATGCHLHFELWSALGWYAQEAARQGVQLRSVKARTEAEVDMSRALGVTDNAPVERIDWHLEVDADAPREQLEELKRLADEHCPGVYCVRNPIELATHLVT